MFGIAPIINIVILIGSIVIHEVAHGFAANKLGDPTAKLDGRLTLNPLKHLDPVGSLLIPGILVITGAPFLFGWAKPVPYNPYNLKNPRRDEALIAAAGPASNILIAIVAAILFRVFMPGLDTLFAFVLLMTVLLNLVLAIFNLVPIPPLDGSKLLFAAVPSSFGNFRATLEGMGFFLVILFIATPLSNFIAPLVFGIAEIFLGIRL
ncbi:MAG: site-2 protease family protein [Candidatus Paceibacterota bacterium]